MKYRIQLRFFWVLLCASASTICLSQSDHVLVTSGCTLLGPADPGKYYFTEPSEQMGRIFDEIIDQAGDDAVFIKLTSSPKPANAIATVSSNGRRMIIYNKAFVEKFQAESLTAWSARFLLAHEIGHHYLRHELSGKSKEENHRDELAADAFAAKILARLGADANEAVAGMSTWRDQYTKNSETHPSPELRIETASQAWQEEIRVLSKPATLPATNYPIAGQARRSLNLDPKAFRNPWNIISEAKAVIDNEKVSVKYSLPARFTNNYKVCVFANKEDVSPGRNPGTLSGTNPKNELTNLGEGKETVWNFNYDRYERKQVEHPKNIRFYVFDPDNMPKAPNSAGATFGAIGTAIGAGLAVWGVTKITGGRDIYENIYKITRQDEDYEEADDKYVAGQAIAAGGIGMLGTGVYLLLHRARRKRMFERSQCSASPLDRLTPTLVHNGMGINYRF